MPKNINITAVFGSSECWKQRVLEVVVLTLPSKLLVGIHILFSRIACKSLSKLQTSTM